MVHAAMQDRTGPNSRRLSRLLPYVALAAVYLAFANGAWFFAETMSIGGDALNGYTTDGHYFVSDHGFYTEVSEATWQFSRIHAISFLISFVLGFASMGYLTRVVRRPTGWFSLPALDDGPPGIVLGLYVLGVVVGVAFLAEGITNAVPHGGGFGVLWTLLVAVIFVVNIVRMHLSIRRGRNGPSPRDIPRP